MRKLCSLWGKFFRHEISYGDYRRLREFLERVELIKSRPYATAVPWSSAFIAIPPPKILFIPR